MNDIMYHKFEVNDNTYEIRFNEKRIELYESSHKPLVGSIINGALSLNELKSLTAYGLCLEGGQWVNPKQGMIMAKELLEENGYLLLFEAVTDALQRDCGFLFKTA